jgi:hypothetical protein
MLPFLHRVYQPASWSKLFGSFVRQVFGESPFSEETCLGNSGSPIRAESEVYIGGMYF